jgi:hypothetical protein
MLSTFVRRAWLATACLASLTGIFPVSANDRNFAYTYEPETMPQGGFEYEQWVTLRAGRNAAVGQEDYRGWEFRHEFEYGVTDNYTLSLYVNYSFAGYRDPASGNWISQSTFDGISIENRYLLLNPVDHSVGLALYLEPRYSGVQAELEEKIILGQRHGDWKWALNLTHATEWDNHFDEVEGEVEASLGLTRDLGKHWSLGLEVRDHNELPDYSVWENTALYFGPVVSYQRDRWWATLAVMPQIFGRNFVDNPSQNNHLELEGHERWNVRLLVGLSF